MSALRLKSDQDELIAINLGVLRPGDRSRRHSMGRIIRNDGLRLGVDYDNVPCFRRHGDLSAVR